MKRSEINATIRAAERFFAAHQFHLPPFARWTPADWAKKGEEAREIVEHGLGWDITDFGQGDFRKCGLVLFTLRNGSIDAVKAGRGKTYCEKLVVVEDGQACPLHFHFVKTEDIINRGGATLKIEIYAAGDDLAPCREAVTLSRDGVRQTLPAGSVVALAPGESVTFDTGCYHRLWGEGGRVLVGEVSVVNDDNTDLHFVEPVGRFPQIDEDEPPLYPLVQEYARFWGAAKR